jgi:hypothetical protein
MARRAALLLLLLAALAGPAFAKKGHRAKAAKAKAAPAPAWSAGTLELVPASHARGWFEQPCPSASLSGAPPAVGAAVAVFASGLCG